MSQQGMRVSRWCQGLVAACLLVLLAVPVRAQVAAGYSEYYIPGSEDAISIALRSLGPTPASLNTHALITITSWSDSVIVYYDHWENGIAFDPENPEATCDEKFTMATTGTLLTLDDTPAGGIPIPRDAADTYYDGGDRMYVVGGAVTVTRVAWRQNEGRAIQAAAWEIYPVKPQLTTYVLPFGQNLAVGPKNYTDFLRTYAIIQATADNTTFTIDLDGNGTADPLDLNFDGDTADAGENQPVTLQAGESFFVGNVTAGLAPIPQLGALATINSNAVIQGNSTLQVKFIVGDPAANYETRGLSAFPRGYWTKEYYAPVWEPTNGTITDIFLYNPNAAAITVAYETAAATGTFTINAKDTLSYRAAVGALPTNGGVYLRGSDAFWGVSTVDSAGQVNEWAYSLLPSTLLYQEHFLGWAPGGADGNDSGVFLTPVQDNTRVFVDTNNDGTVDQTYTLNRLQTQYITDTDGDLSGTRFWATGPFTMSYGQNPDTAPAQATSGDLGYVAIPGTDFISLVLTVDKSVNPQVVPPAIGSTATFTLTVNSRKYDVDGVSVVDTLPANWAYVNDSAVVTLPDRNELTLAAANPTVGAGTLTWPAAMLGSMVENQEIVITFTAQTTAALPDGTLSQNRVRATGTRTVGGQIQTFNATDFAYVASGSLGITKTSTAPDPAYPGDQFVYTATVTNPAGGATQTGVSLYDPMPAGVSYVPASGSVSCVLTGNYNDQFSAVAYNNSNGSRDWSATPWVETDSLGGGAASGLAVVTGGVLRLGYAVNVRDEFATAAYNLNGPNNTANWATNWTESDDDNSASTTGNRHIYIDDAGTLFFDRAVTTPGGVNMGISRTAGVAGVTSATIGFTPTDSGFDAGEAVVARYYTVTGGVESGPYVLGTYDGDTAGWSGVAQSFTIPNGVPQPLPANTDSIRLEFISSGDWNNNGDEMFIDNVDMTYRRTPTVVQRPANLAGAASATLSFSLTNANLEAGDTFVVEASGDGTNFTVLDTYTSATGTGAKSYNLKSPTDYTAATAAIRFRVLSGFDQADETFSVDNVDIDGVAPTTFASGNPPAFLRSSAGCQIPPGGTLTLTYNVTVDNPLASGLTSATNTAAVTTATYPIQLTASVTDPLANPSALSASVAGRVWLDDGDGVQEVGEPGIAGVEITLKDEFGTPKGTVVVGDNGRYLFTGIAAGSGYYVEATDGLRPGTTQSYPAVPPYNRTAAFNLAAGQEKTGVDLGYETDALTAAFGDLAWVDADGDGVRNAGEVGLGGVGVTLWQDTVADGSLDTSCADVLPEDPPGCDTQAGAATTAPDGSYLFTGITATGAETYFVLAVEAAGYVSTGAASHRFFNTATGSYLTADFGFQADGVTVTTHEISDRVWLDSGVLGAYEDGEPGIAGVAVELLDTSSNVIATTATAADGTFIFSGVRGGGADYIVRISDTTGVLVDHFGTSTYALERFRDVDNLTASVDRTAPGDASFGFSVSRSIGDTVFNDSSGADPGDGVQQPGELGIAGVVARLYRDNGASAGLLDGSDTLVGTVATDAAGRYLFSGLANADYIVSVTPPAGYNYVGVLDADADPAAGIQRTATISGGGNDLSADFGFRAPLQHTLFGMLWEDDNADGAIDVEETARLAGVTIDVLSGTIVVATVTTDVNGQYAVNGLAAGAYNVRVTDAAGVLTGYFATVPASGEQGVNLAGGNPAAADFGFRMPPVTRVFLAGFRATAAPQGVLVEWETTAEIGTVGYRILRVEGGAEVPVNERIVPAFIESRSGGRYALADPGASGSPLTYILLEVRRTGEPVPYGPFTVTPVPARAPRAALAAPPALSSERAYARAPLALPDGKAYARESRRPAPALAPSRQTVALDPSVPQFVAVGSKMRIAVTRDGLYRLFASEIAGLLGRKVGGIVTRINEGSLLLSSRGLPVAYLPRDNGASLVFRGTALDTNFTGENVYWLEIGAGKRMRQAVATAAKPSAKAKHFADRLRIKERTWPDFLAATDPNADYWLWKYLVAGDEDYDSAAIPLDTPSPAGAGLKATLTVRLVGGNDSPANPDHHVLIRLNGTQIGEASWNGLATIDVPCAFDQGLLTGTDKVEIEALLDTDAPESIVYLESLHLAYHRRFVAVDNRLAFTGGGNAAVTISGFTDRAILLFDLTHPNRPRLLSGATIAGSEGNYSISFKPASPTIPYLAVARSAAGLPDAVAAWNSTGLADATNAAEYLVITGTGLLEAAGALADRRAGQGLSTKVVTVPAIMDEFNAGIHDPAAIRAFLTTAHDTWTVPPRYVLLAGDGSYDYRDFTDETYGPTDTPIVPPAFVPTPYGLAAADGWYADVDGDHVPEAAVGRLPALTNTQLQGLVDKIAAFEDAAPGDGETSILLLADNRDAAAGDFPADTDALIAALPAGLTTTTDYVGATTISAARTLLQRTVDTGVAHVTYFGHGGFDRLADEQLLYQDYLNSSDPGVLTPVLGNGERLPLFTLFTCVAGDFTDPFLVNLGEGLLLREGGGASAVLAPTGSAVHGNSAWLAGEFFALRYGGGGGPRLGDTIVGAMRAYKLAHDGDFTLDVYNLLGDPGLR